MKKTLILSCCGPCSAGVVEFFAKTKRSCSVMFYNPNIDTKEEHELRAQENKRLCDFFNIPYIHVPHEPQVWLEQTKDFATEPERGKRCSLCFSLRLKKAAEYAKENGFDCFTSVLGVSRYKNLDQVNACAENISYEKIPDLGHGVAADHRTLGIIVSDQSALLGIHSLKKFGSRNIRTPLLFDLTVLDRALLGYQKDIGSLIAFNLDRIQDLRIP